MIDQLSSFFRGFQSQPQPRSGFAANRNTKYEVSLACYPMSFSGKDELEKGNKIILPSSALEVLARLNVSWPMVFEILNEEISVKTNCGVMEFSAPEGMCYVPHWMMENLFLSAGDVVKISNTNLPTGSFIKIRPLTSNFLKISDPRIVLEQSLRYFATLTVGDVIPIQYGLERFSVEIMAARPSDAILIIEADVQVDFEAPKDYVEPTKPTAPAVVPTEHMVDEEGEKDDDEPWKRRLPQGVRTSNYGFDLLVREGKVAKPKAVPDMNMGIQKNGSFKGNVLGS